MSSSKTVVERPLQLIQFQNASSDNDDASGGIQLNQENLDSVLSRTKGNPLSIICVCGPSRQGKSFILGYMLRCLEALENDETDWMDWENKDKPLSGFKFQNGMSPETQGIWIWSKPFNIKVGEDGDQPLSVLLVDTQGTYDEFTNSRTMASIVGISVLMSSSMVFNFFKQLQEDVLGSLETYVNYGKLALEDSTDSSKPFQKLTFLIRDWNNPGQFPYGGKGGNAFLQEKLELKDGQSPQAKSIRETIKACFETLDCYLMPHPGDKAIDTNFTGAIGELSTAFAKKMEDFINILINPDDICCKQVFGSPITAVEFQSLLNSYIEVFNSAETPTPHTMLEATSHVVNQNAVEKALQKYREVLKKHQRSNKFIRGQPLQEADKQGRKQAKSNFSSARKFGGPERIQELEEELESKISKEFKDLKKGNEDKWEAFIQAEVNLAEKTFVEEMSEQFPFGGDENPFEHYDEAALIKKGKAEIENIMDDFDEKLGEEDEAASVKVKSNLEQILRERIVLENQARQKQAEKEVEKLMVTILSEYEMEINEDLKQNQWLDSSQLDKLHLSKKPDMLKRFSEEQKKYLPKGKPSKSTNTSSSDTVSKLESELEKIHQTAVVSQNVRLQEAQLEADKLIEELVAVYTEQLQAKSQTSDLNALETFHSGALSNVKEVFGARCPSLGSSSNWGKLVERWNALYENAIHAITQREREAKEKVHQAINESFSLYHNEMTKKLKAVPFLKDADLENAHQQGRLMAINNFEGYGIIDEESELALRISADYSQFKADNQQKFELAQSEATNLVNQCQTQYQTKMKMAIDTAKSDEALKSSHEEALQQAKSDFSSKCPVKDDEFTGNYIRKLETDIEETFEELAEVFELKMGEEEVLTTDAIINARKMYDNEMTTHFKNHEFIRPQELNNLHQRVVDRCVARSNETRPLSQGQKTELMEALKLSFEKYKEQNDMNLECDDVAIGIDLGTTYSCVAVYVNGSVRVIPNSLGKNTTPSYVQYNENGVNTVGDSAKRRAYENPENTIFDAKRIIGRKITDEKLQQDMKMWPFTVEDDGGVPKINVRGKTLYPEQISAEILKEMKSSAEKYLMRDVKKAVITVPAYFTDGQRQATKDAGELAGLEVLTILTEPVAAAIAYKKQHADTFGGGGEQRNILIFDLGGGTFDVAVLKSTHGKLDVLEVGGDDHLGGEDFDRSLMEYCAMEFKRTTGLDLFDGKDSTQKQTRDDARRRLKRLQLECERKKIDLSSARRMEVSVDSLFRGSDLNVVINRDKFEELNATPFETTIRIVDKTLQDAKMRKDQIDDIVLVGGSTRIPKIKELLTNYFGGKALDESINPDEAVAWGAAMKAAFMNGAITKESIDFTKIQDVTPMSIGVEVYGGGFSVIIPKGTKIPVKAQERYRTAHNNQTSVQVTIYQGEEVIAVQNKHLGDFYLNGIPPKDAERENIDVEMVINAQGILHVNAVCSSTGDRTGITVTENKQRMSRTLIKMLLDEATPA